MDVRIIWVAIPLWFWWSVMAEPASLLAAMARDQHSLLFKNLPEINFTTDGATKASYSKLIQQLRDQLANLNDVRYGIPVLREPSTVPDSQRYFVVQLSNCEGHSVALGIDMTNAYAVAYSSRGRSFFFQDSPEHAENYLFTDTERSSLPFGSNYHSLERVAHASREEIPLGILELTNAINNLYWSNEPDNRAVARSLIVCAQMILEAARFGYIEGRVLQSIRCNRYENFTPGPAMMKLETSWDALSGAVQNSLEGVFLNPVQLRSRSNLPVPVDNVNHISVVGNLLLMLFICRNKVPQFAMLIQPVVAHHDDDTCPNEEPIVHIRGRDGLCVDVADERYNDGNPIILWPCKSNDDVNQLWTLKRDGTIRSNGKCLTTYGYSPGQYVMIYNCSTAAKDATIWQVWVNGTIINPESGLVLTPSGTSGTTLTVDTNTFASRQGWLGTNNTQPLVISIVGYMDLCLQAHERNVWLEECDNNNLDQEWVPYPDGSIRPYQDHIGFCLACDDHEQERNVWLEECNNNVDQQWVPYPDASIRPYPDHIGFCLACDDHEQERSIVIRDCSSGSPNQRWMFTEDGTIFNLKYRMVMDVKNSDPSLRKIILYPPTSNPNQKWLPMP